MAPPVGYAPDPRALAGVQYPNAGLLQQLAASMSAGGSAPQGAATQQAYRMAGPAPQLQQRPISLKPLPVMSSDDIINTAAGGGGGGGGALGGLLGGAGQASSLINAGDNLSSLLGSGSLGATGAGTAGGGAAGATAGGGAGAAAGGGAGAAASGGGGAAAGGGGSAAGSGLGAAAGAAAAWTSVVAGIALPIYSAFTAKGPVAEQVNNFKKLANSDQQGPGWDGLRDWARAQLAYHQEHNEWMPPPEGSQIYGGTQLKQQPQR